MRPIGSTPVASAMTRPEPETAKPPRCCMCQSWGTPSTALYWHIGETAMRLGRVRPRNVSGRKRCGGSITKKLRGGFALPAFCARGARTQGRETGYEWAADLLFADDIGPQEDRVIGLGPASGGDSEDGIGRGLLGRSETASIEFKEQDSNDKARPLVAVNKGMVLDDAGGVGARHIDQVSLAIANRDLLGAGEGGSGQSLLAQSLGAAVRDQEPFVQGEDIRRILGVGGSNLFGRASDFSDLENSTV